MILKNPPKHFLYSLGLLALLGCGGGGGGSSSTSSGRQPVASAPVCKGDVVVKSTAQAPRVGGSASGVFVPASSVRSAFDIGKRMHTNHLILTSSMTRGNGPSGLSPAQVAGAYGLTNPTGAGAIAIVDAFSYPTVLNDFNTFSTQFSLPTETSTDVTASTNTTLQVVYAGGTQPTPDGSWAQEMAIDIQWAHAMAPKAKIYLVEAASDSFTDVMAAIAVAKALPGVREVSTSFGNTEDGCSYVQYDSTFVKAGVAFFAAAGDVAGERDFPALSSNVVAVGGTTLNVSATGTWTSETAWDGTGCGPSIYEPRPVFQDSVYSKVGLYRGGCDIAAVADPLTGVSVYDSYAYQGTSGWFVVGGTSVACPIIAGIANNAGVAFTSSQAFNSAIYAQAGSKYFHAITSGSSGGFAAESPYSFPTGLGTPNALNLVLAGG